MRKSLVICVLGFLAACSSVSSDSSDLQVSEHNNSPNSNVIQSMSPVASPTGSAPPVTVSNTEISIQVGCSLYRLESKKGDEHNLIRVLQENGESRTIELPTGLTVNGFSLRSVEKTKNGFRFSIDYGSRYYYMKAFHFTCNAGEFYLTKVLTNTHDQADPEKTGKQFTSRIIPPIPIDQFSIDEFMKE